MNFRRRLAAFSALLVLALGIAGCGETVLDQVKSEATIKSDLEDAFGEKVTSVTCPADVEVKKGQAFTCTVTFPDGNKATASLEIRNSDADVSLVGLKPKK